MKTKFFTLFAAFVLLFSANASAQTNGDVNGDGKVDEQDIAAILEIMAEAGGVKEQTKYYWYVGQTEPTAENYTTLAESSSTNYTNKNYTTEKFGKVYILVPNIVKSIKVKEVNANVYWEDAAMSVTNPISGYNLYTTNAPKGGSAPLVIEYYYNETTYYWYVGNGDEIVKNDPVAADIDWSKAQQITSFEALGYSANGTKITMNKTGENNVYILCPKSWSNKWQFWNVDNTIDLTTGFSTFSELLEIPSFTKDGVEYDLWMGEGYAGNIAHMRSK